MIKKTFAEKQQAIYEKKIDLYEAKLNEIRKTYKKTGNLGEAIKEVHTLSMNAYDYKPSFNMFTPQQIEFDNYKRRVVTKINEYEVELKLTNYHMR
jgi:hypothetical protein